MPIAAVSLRLGDRMLFIRVEPPWPDAGPETSMGDGRSRPRTRYLYGTDRFGRLQGLFSPLRWRW